MKKEKEKRGDRMTEEIHNKKKNDFDGFHQAEENFMLKWE
jgi:hypothetical protein